MFGTKKRHVPLLGERRRKIVEKIPPLKGVEEKWHEPFPAILLFNPLPLILPSFSLLYCSFFS